MAVGAITAFIPEVWSAQLLVNLETTHVYGQPGAVNRNYEGDISQFGDTVHIVSLLDPTIGDYTAHTDIAIEPVGDELQTLVIDQSKYFAFEVDDIETRQARGNVMDEQARKSGYLLSDTADKFLAGRMKTGAQAANVLAAVGADGTPAAPGDLTERLIDAKIRLDEENVPSQGRWVIVAPAVHGLLLRDPQFVRVDESGTSTGLRNGQVGRAFGFDIMLSNNAPATAGTTDTSYTMIGGYNGATTFAEQIAKVEAFNMERRFNQAVKGLHLYGAKVIRPEGLVTAEVWV